MGNKKTAKKANGKSAAKKVKKAVKTIVKLSPSAKVAFLKTRPGTKDSPKNQLLALVPRKGTIAVKALVAKAEAAELKSTRIPGWIGKLARYGYVEVRA
jgi:hypothetical protein